MSIEEDVKRCKELIKIEHANWIGMSNQSAISNVLAELEQDKKRMQELENKLQDINTYILTNGIDKPLRTATQIQVENQHEYIIQEKINTLEKRLENSIPKQEVKDKIEEIEEKMKYEDNEKMLIYLHKQRKVLRELLKGEKIEMCGRRLGE